MTREIMTKLNMEDRKDLVAYADANGRTWRSKLSDDWARGSAVLRAVRDKVGPSGLYAIRACDLVQWRMRDTLVAERGLLKSYHVRVFRDGSEGHRDIWVTACSEITARTMAFFADGGLHPRDDIERGHVELALTWTEILGVLESKGL